MTRTVTNLFAKIWVAAIFIAASLQLPLAHAQTSASTERTATDGLAEILVTARRRS